jgi:molybdate transport system substrate-binding protein
MTHRCLYRPNRLWNAPCCITKISRHLRLNQPDVYGMTLYNSAAWWLCLEATVSRVLLAIGIATAVSISAVSGADIKVISANGMGKVITDTRAKFEATSRHTLTVTVASPGEVRSRVLAGESFDVIIVPRDISDELLKMNYIVPGTVVALMRINFGLAVESSGLKPDVNTPEALKRTLLDAKSVIITDPATGAISGVHFVEVLNKLGITDQMKDKLVLHPDGDSHARRVAQGQADLGVQAEHEIRCTRGVAFLDYPAALQRTFALTGGVGRSASDFAAAKSYLAFITGPETATAYTANCLVPPAPPR